jgi:hypothetical protein
MTSAPTTRNALRELRSLASACAALAESFDDSEVAVVEALPAWKAADCLERAAAAIKTVLAVKVEETAAWKAAGYRSAADQLARLGGTTVAVARQSLETSKKLATLPDTKVALQRGTVEGDEVCEIVGVGSVPVRTARELLGDAILHMVITKGIDVANVVHLGRGPTAAQRVAFLWQQPKCSNIGCSSTFTQVDHRQPWATNQETVLENLDPLCPHCHKLKSLCGWSLVDGKGRREFVPPTDPHHPKHKPPP